MKYKNNFINNTESLDSNFSITDSCSSNNTICTIEKDIPTIIDYDNINLNKINVLKEQNSCSLNKAELLLQLAHDAYVGIKNDITYFKNQLKEFPHENDSIDRKRYDDLVKLFYNSLVDYFEMYSVDNKGNKNKILFKVHDNNYFRNVSFTYIAPKGIVQLPSIAQFDNVSLENNTNEIIIQIGKFKYRIRKSSSINNLKEKIFSTRNNFYLIEDEIEKNIKLLKYSLNIINCLRNNI